MELINKFVVLRNTETGTFLQEYKSRGTLAYEAEYVNSLTHATKMSFESFEEQKEKVELLAQAFDCEILVVEATYDLKYLNGEDVKEVEPTVNEKSIVDILREVAQEMGLDKAGE